MNKTTEQIQQERIDVLTETIDVMNRIIKTNEEQLQVLYTRIELGKQTESINTDTIAKLFAAAKKDKEVIKQFKLLINQQGKQIIDLQKENDSLFSTSCNNETTLALQKEVKQLIK